MSVVRRAVALVASRGEKGPFSHGFNFSLKVLLDDY